MQTDTKEPHTVRQSTNSQSWRLPAPSLRERMESRRRKLSNSNSRVTVIMGAICFTSLPVSGHVAYFPILLVTQPLFHVLGYSNDFRIKFFSLTPHYISTFTWHKTIQKRNWVWLTVLKTPVYNSVETVAKHDTVHTMAAKKQGRGS